MTTKHILIVGTGQMAIDYTKVLQAQEHNFTVVGRGKESASKFREVTGIEPVIGGIESYLKSNSLYDNTFVIIATGTQDLMKSMLTVLKAGAHRVLVEKPAAISIEELVSNQVNLEPHFDKIYVAYNRRFYASVEEAKRIINEDGGLLSLHFEFTEWAHKIEPLSKAPCVKENWFFANSTHIIDLAFYLAGKPVDWKAYSNSGKLNWHKNTNFVGAGITDRGVLFSYISNWESAGRWGIELLTEKRRIHLKPIENIFVQMKGSIKISEYLFDKKLDESFKPGIYNQVLAFINDNEDKLLRISEQIDIAKNVYAKMNLI